MNSLDTLMRQEASMGLGRIGTSLLPVLITTVAGTAAAQTSEQLEPMEIQRRVLATGWPVERAYDPAVIEVGRALFQDNCAACHGRNAEGTTAEWRKRDQDGKYPPPPLNGTAHAWHHPIPVLSKTIREGTIGMGGSMPAQGEKLGPAEIVAIIHWMTSLWPDDIFRMWQQRGGLQ